MNNANEIKALLRERVAELAQYLFTSGHREGNHWVVGSIEGEPGRSFKICIAGEKAGLWGDFADSGKHSRSLLDLWMRARNVDFKTALRQAAEWLGQPLNRATQSASAAKSIRTFPTINEAIRFAARTLKMLVTRRDVYHDRNGNEHFVVVRFDNNKGKEFRPFCRRRSGWVMSDPPGKLPLFHLPDLLARPRELVLNVEGEKCVCELAPLGLLVTTSAHGANSAHKTDWQPLAGREVVILPDNDEDGRAYSQTVAGILLQLSPPAVVRIVELPGLLPKGDCVEWLDPRDGQTPEDITAELLELVKNAEVIREAIIQRIEVADVDGGAQSSNDTGSAPQPGEFPLDALNPVMRAIAEQSAEVYQIKPELPAMAGVATLAGAIGKGFLISGAVSGRETNCNVYVFPGAPKSYGKNAASIMAAPLRDASNEIAKAFRETERPSLLAEKKISEKREQSLVNYCASDATTESERKEKPRELAKIQRRLDEIESLLAWPPTYLIGNATSAALTEILKRNCETIFSFSPEAGEVVRIALGKFTKDRAADFDLYLSGYTVESARETRISRGDSGELVPCISVLWFCQPFLLRELFTNEEALERGLTARVLPFIVEHEGDIPEDDGIVRCVSESARQAWDSLVRKVLTCRESPHVIQCSPEAREVFRVFHNEAVRLRNGKYREIEGELGRWRENAIKIAGGQCVADALSKGNDAQSLTLTADQAERGVKIGRWNHLHSLAMLNKGLANRQWQRVETLQALLSRYGGTVTLRDLRDRHGFVPHEIKMLAAEYSHALSIQTHKPTTGRPSEILTLPKS